MPVDPEHQIFGPSRGNHVTFRAALRAVPGASGAKRAKSGPIGPSRGQRDQIGTSGASGAGFGFADVSFLYISRLRGIEVIDQDSKVLSVRI